MPVPCEPLQAVLVGGSVAMAAIRARIERLGAVASPVLILGETGTGKEVVARAIHQAGGRDPFVPIDCTLLGPLLETELFGHVKGAFTGAVAAKPGLLEHAGGGTAFFDEIGDLPVELQSKLLRVLQDKEIRPLGSLARRRVEFRVLAATNRDLAPRVEAGAFRRDLYYRLNVVTLRLPPLRERKEDIPELAACFLERCGAGGRRLGPALMELLMRHDWPGNVRELESCIQRLVTVNSGPELQPYDLPTALQGGASITPAAAAPAGVIPLRDMERSAIVNALAYTRNDRGRAAELLGISRTTLYRKMKEYGKGPDR